MYKKLLAGVFMVAVAISGCSSEPEFVVKTGAEDAGAFNPASAQARFRPDTRRVAFTITNFPVDDAWYQTALDKKMTEPGQRYIMFTIPGAPDVPYKEMLTTGAHDIQHVEILEYKEGPGYQRTNMDRDNHQGNVTITEVTETQVKGTIDMSDEKGVTVKGEFTANRI